MPLSPEPAIPGNTGTRGFGHGCRNWNRRLHIYLGLYFLFFVWLFALSGLLLNHGSWTFARFWPDREITNDERAFVALPAGSPLEQAHDLMRQLGLVGEVQWLATRPDPNRLEFRVNRPGTNIETQADLKTSRAKIQRTAVNAWGVLQTLHTFTGVHAGDTQNRRDWLLTTVWALAMDAIALGLMGMVAGGLVMWWNLPTRRTGGLIALASGALICGWFVSGLRWS